MLINYLLNYNYIVCLYYLTITLLIYKFIQVVNIFLKYNKYLLFKKIATIEFLKKYYKKYNKTNRSYVLITGCTSGIGKKYSELFAKLNLNLILVSRSLSKLNELKKELYLVNSNIDIIVIKFDFSLYNNIKTYEDNLFNIISHLDVTIIINNVGIYNGSFFKEVNYSLLSNEIKPYIDINIISCLYISNFFINYVKKNIEKQSNNDNNNININKNNYLIINCSSISGVCPDPSNALYSATKAFILDFSTKLNKEVNNININVISTTPSYVQTNMVPLPETGIRIINANQHCISVLYQITNNIKSTSGYITHQIENLLLLYMPEHLKRMYFNYDIQNY